MTGVELVASSGRHQIAGVVLNSRGRPLAGATVIAAPGPPDRDQAGAWRAAGHLGRRRHLHRRRPRPPAPRRVGRPSGLRRRPRARGARLARRPAAAIPPAHPSRRRRGHPLGQAGRGLLPRGHPGGARRRDPGRGPAPRGDVGKPPPRHPRRPRPLRRRPAAARPLRHHGQRPRRPAGPGPQRRALRGRDPPPEAGGRAGRGPHRPGGRGNTGAPIAEARVSTLLPGFRNNVTTTDASGAFHLPGVLPSPVVRVFVAGTKAVHQSRRLEVAVPALGASVDSWAPSRSSACPDARAACRLRCGRGSGGCLRLRP